LKIAVAAPPEKGKANQALIEFLAELTGISKQQVKLTSGETNPQKTLTISGIEPKNCIELLQGKLGKPKK
jgi:uncharacterized protein (TIGR00251 family)